MWKPVAEWAIQDKKGSTLKDDSEIKIFVQINRISGGKDILEDLESKIFSWHKMKGVAAMVLRYKKVLIKKIRNRESQGEIMINNCLLKETEIEVIRMLQSKKFAAKIKTLEPRYCNSDEASTLKGNSKIFQIDPFFDKDGMICVGGRLFKSYLNDSCKHPILLPKKERVSLLVMQCCHSKSAHGARGLTLNELRSSGYWVICGNAAVKKMIFHCVQYRRLHGRLVEQK